MFSESIFRKKFPELCNQFSLIYFLDNNYCDDLFCSETEHMLVLFNAFVQNIVKGISDTVEYPFGDKGNPE